MATATTEKTVYPRINEAVWWKLRNSFRGRLPGVVDEAYLHGVLGYNEASARTLMTQLKRVGIINDEGKPTDLANRWRHDDQYAAVCEEIVDSVYPPGLRDAFHDPSDSRDAVASYIAHATRAGEDTAQGQAKFYLMLLKADVADANAKPAQTKAPKAPKKEESNSRRRSGAAAQAAAGAAHSASADLNRDEQAPTSGPQTHSARTITPSIHLDFQIHIAADSSPELIDTIFESMAKHLRTLMSEARE